MLIEVKEVALKASFTVETFVDIVEYKKRYEPHDKVTLTQYLNMVVDEDRAIDTVCDVLFYPHAIKMRKAGVKPLLEWRDVAVYLATNTKVVNEVIQDLIQSLPEPEEKPKKKTSKTTKAGS